MRIECAACIDSYLGNFSSVVVDAEHRLAATCALAPGTPVLAGLRPERLKLDVGRGETEPIGKGTVLRVSSDGLLCTVTIAWAGHELRTHLVAGRGLAKTLAPGDVVLMPTLPFVTTSVSAEPF